jgi:PAS domain S-box-containing protein/putative nucleotidyltransferase with HDIG domain
MRKQDKEKRPEEKPSRGPASKKSSSPARKPMKNSLWESESQVKQLIDSSPVAMIVSSGVDERVESINAEFTELFGYTLEDIPDVAHWWPLAYPDEIYREEIKTQWKARVAAAIRDKGKIDPMEATVRCRDGSSCYVEFRFSSMGQRHLVTFVDLTERRQAELQLTASEQKFRSLAESSPDNIIRYDAERRKVYVNRNMDLTVGFNLGSHMGKTPVESTHVPGIDDYDAKLRRVIRTGQPEELENLVPNLAGELRTHNIRFVAERNNEGKIIGAMAFGHDITERKRAEDEHLAQLRFVERMDRVDQAIQGTNDLDQMMRDVLDVLLSIFDCDRAWLVYPCDPEAATWQVPMERTRAEYPGVLPIGVDLPMDPAGRVVSRILRDSIGAVKFGPESAQQVPAEMAQEFSVQSFIAMALYPKVGKPWSFGLNQCSHARVWNSEEERLFQEVGRRLSDALTGLLVYRNLRESEERYRRLVEFSPDSISIYSEGRIVFANSSTLRLSGANRLEDLLGRTVLDFVHPDYREAIYDRINQMLSSGEPLPFVEVKFLRMDGSPIDVEVAAVPYNYQGKTYVQIIARDISERKHHELEREAMITVGNAMRAATTRAGVLTIILDQLVDLFDADGAMLVLPDPQTGGFIDEMGRGAVGEKMTGLNIPPGKGVCNWVITHKKPYLNNHADRDPLFYRPDLLGDSHCIASVPLITHQEQTLGALWIARGIDITDQEVRLLSAIANIAANTIHRVTLYEQTEQQVQRLTALHQIDIAISTNFELNITLNVILNNVKHQLDVDAASILLLAPVTQTLDYAAGAGFRTRGIERAHVKLGEGYAGRAALEYRVVACPNLEQAQEASSRSTLFTEEEFKSHFVAPLLVKSQVKGVLEVFHRKPLEPAQEWLSYFETLATQAAIAIDNASLFENLNRSNTELTLAYDATIEGWSHALDLRDRETEGHTQRVAEMALRLADKVGMNDIEKLNLRRGALLHDIGKMGIPDTILLKAGPLTEEEWKVMRQHPLYAYEMLSPIAYLRQALVVPYCHHEKWDGSGYPRGLKGEEIPFAARVFAVVDVFDALSLDRPYRPAWSREAVLEYIREQAGRHFDPAIVKPFLEMQ